MEPVTVDPGCEGVLGAGQADSVEVAAEEEPPAAGVVATAQDDAGSTGRAFEDLGAQSDVPPPGGDEGGDVRLPGAVSVEAGVDRLDAEQRVEEIQDRHVVRPHGWSARRRTTL